MKFKLIKKEELKDIRSIGYWYQHIKTKAEVVIVKNEDKNLIFDINFPTLLNSSTGVAHVLEHSIFSGSKKYPSKNILSDLKSTGVVSIINASTYKDLTNFYFSTYYSKKFIEVMDIYLDMVFNPLIYQDDMIFKQEGIRLDYDKESNLIFNGIVFNEMKGTLNKGKIIYDSVYKNLYPNTVYKYDSGGDVKEIPNLTNELLQDFHTKYYHPSNSYTYLYGDINIDESLEKLDEYFSSYDYKEIKKDYGNFTPLKEKKYKIKVPEDKENKLDLVLAYHMENLKIRPILYHLLSYLTDKTSLLHKRLIDTLLVNNIGYSNYKTKFNTILFNFSGIEEKNIDKVIAIFKETISEVCKKGIDKEKLEAHIKRISFHDKKEVLKVSPGKGLIYDEAILTRLLYGKDDIFKYLRYEEDLKAKKSFKDSDFEKFVEENILNNDNYVILKCIPTKDLSKIDDEEIKLQLEKIKLNLSENDKNNIIKTNELLKEEKKSIVSLPKLLLDDVTKIIPKEYAKEEVINNIKYLFYEADTLRINQVSLMFDIKHLNKELYYYLYIYLKLLKGIATNNYNLKELLDKINSDLGSLNIGIDLYNNLKNDKEYKHYLNFKAEYEKDNVNNFIDIFDEIIFNQDFKDIKNIKNILKNIKLFIEDLYKDGSFLTNNFISYELGYSNRMFKNITVRECYNFIKEILKDFDNKYNLLIKNFEEIKERVFNINNMVVTFIGNKDDYECFKININKYLSKFKNDAYEEVKLDNIKASKSKAFVIDKKVNYITQAFKLDTKIEDSLICNIVTNKYLMKNIRVNNGAYGAGMTNNTSYISLYTYRDPKLKESLDVFKSISEYIKNINLTQEELTNYKILTNHLDNPKSIFSKGNIAINNNLSYTDLNELQEELDYMFNMTLNDIQNKYKIYENGLNNSVLAISSDKDTIKLNENLFEEVEDFLNE